MLFSTSSAIALSGLLWDKAMMVIAFQSSPILSLPRERSRVLAAAVPMAATCYLKIAHARNVEPHRRNLFRPPSIVRSTVATYLRPSGCVRPSRCRLRSLQNFPVIEIEKAHQVTAYSASSAVQQNPQNVVLA